ncbi:MAG TPA: hypothetical protein VM715_00300, partial [Candidatus Acidoferrum sp.]|nr:hypothetical protein [Candidatus Acidoferrum sp.]
CSAAACKRNTFPLVVGYGSGCGLHLQQHVGGVRMSDHMIIFILIFGTVMFVLAGLERIHGPEKSKGDT